MSCFPLWNIIHIFLKLVEMELIDPNPSTLLARYSILTLLHLCSYASMWKGCLTLYTGRGGDLQKIGE